MNASDTAGLSVTVLGSSGTYAGAGGACTGFLLRSGSTAVLLDAGPGTLANLQEHLDLADLDAVVLSHSHPDHWLELPVLRNALKYVVGRDEVPLYLTAETLALADPLASTGLAPTFAPEVITSDDEIIVGPIRLVGTRTDHPVETLAFRVEAAGRSLGYTADTGPQWSATALGDPLDVLICEATFLDGSEFTSPVHLSARQAGEMAREAGAGRLVITHLLPVVSHLAALDEAAAAYGQPVELAEPHRRFEI